MKKIICITIVLAMLMGLVPVGVGAESTVEKPNSTTGAEAVSTEDEQEWLFYQNYHDIYFAGPFYDPRFDRVEFYEEVYYHHNDSGEIDWALVHVRQYIQAPWEARACGIFRDRVIRCDAPINQFDLDYAVYFVNENRFFGINGKLIYERITEDDLYNALCEINLGEIIGDIDKDGKLTVKDATYIQKCVAGLLNYPEDDEIRYDGTEAPAFLIYISDFNRDVERNVKDATAIQKHIAGLE